MGNLTGCSSLTAGARKLKFYTQILRAYGELLTKLRFKVPIDSNGVQKVK